MKQIFGVGVMTLMMLTSCNGGGTMGAATETTTIDLAKIDSIAIGELVDSMAVIHIPFENGLAGKPDVGFEDLQNYQYLSNAPVPVGNLVYFTYADGQGMIQTRMWRKGGETVFQQSDNNDKNCIYWNIVGADGNRLIAYIDDPQAYDAMVEKGFGRMPGDVEKHLYNEGGVLMFYHMKQ